jgi:hypothetical protein
MKETDYIKLADLESSDQVIQVKGDYIPGTERRLRRTVYCIIHNKEGYRFTTGLTDFNDLDMLAEAVFWSLGELINNANKANNRLALLRNALFQKITSSAGSQKSDPKEIYQDIDDAILHNQSDILKKYGIEDLDLTDMILRLITLDKTNSFALSEKFNKKIDVTLRIRKKNKKRTLIINVINNSPMTLFDKERVEYNLEKIKDDLIRAGRNPFEAAVRLYDRSEDHRGGGFGAGLRSIVLFLKEAFAPFNEEIMYSRLIQYRTAVSSTLFTIELPIP